MASFRCYNNSDVIANLITTNFHLYLIHLWWQLFQMFVCGDVVYAQTWQVLTLKNCMEPFSYASAAYVVASALVSVRLFRKNLGNLQKFFGQMVYRPLPPPPGKKQPVRLWTFMSYCVLLCLLYQKESANKRYRKKKNNKNTVNNLILPNTVSQNDENRIPKSQMIPQYRMLKLKLPK